MVEPVETLTLEFAGYQPGLRLGGIALEYESTMVSAEPSMASSAAAYTVSTVVTTFTIHINWEAGVNTHNSSLEGPMELNFVPFYSS